MAKDVAKMEAATPQTTTAILKYLTKQDGMKEAISAKMQQLNAAEEVKEAAPAKKKKGKKDPTEPTTIDELMGDENIVKSSISKVLKEKMQEKWWTVTKQEEALSGELAAANL